MTVDSEKVKDALDDFEDDKFTDAKEKLSDVIGKARDEFLKKALNLKGEPEKREEPEDEKEKEETKDDAEKEDASSKEDEKKARKKRVSKAIKKKQDKE